MSYRDYTDIDKTDVFNNQNPLLKNSPISLADFFKNYKLLEKFIRQEAAEETANLRFLRCIIFYYIDYTELDEFIKLYRITKSEQTDDELDALYKTNWGRPSFHPKESLIIPDIQRILEEGAFEWDDNEALN